MASGDWIKLHRKMLEHPVLRNPWLCQLWVWCLLRANYSEQQFEDIVLQPGQFATGRDRGAESLKVSPSKFRRGLVKLSSPSWKLIELKSDSRFSVVTICNWKTYQESGSIERTTSGQQADNNRTTDGQQVDTIEEGKKEKNISVPRTTKQFKPPTIEEVSEHCKSRGNSVDAEKFVAYYTANGWRVGKNPMKNWKAAIVTWEKNSFQSGPAKHQAAELTDAEIHERALEQKRLAQELINR